MIPLVAVESPHAARGVFTRHDHTMYALLAMADALARGEAPYLSHLLYTQVLADTVPDQRVLGMAAGAAWSERADYAAVYADLGVTPGMQKQIDHYRATGKRYELRFLFPDVAVRTAVNKGEMTILEAVATRLRNTAPEAAQATKAPEAPKETT